MLLRYRAHAHTPLHKHTGIHKPTHTHYTLECRWSNIGVEFDIDIRNGRTNWARWGYWCEGGTTPTTGTVEPTGRGRRKVPGGKEQIPLGAAGMWRAASSRESFKGFSLTLNRLSDQTYVFVFNRGFINPIPEEGKLS